MNTRQISNDLTYVSWQCSAMRKIANKTQNEISEITGMGINTIYRIETGQRIPDLDQLFRYCYALNIPMAELLPPSMQSNRSTNPLPFFNLAYCQLTETNKELALQIINALINVLLSQQKSNP